MAGDPSPGYHCPGGWSSLLSVLDVVIRYRCMDSAALCTWAAGSFDPTGNVGGLAAGAALLEAKGDLGEKEEVMACIYTWDSL